MKVRRRTWTAALGLAAAGLLGAAAFAVRGGEDDAGVPTARVVRGPFVRKVHAEGVLKAVQATKVTAPAEASGALNVVWVAPDGSRVRGGDVVIRFDPTEAEQALREGRADYQKALHRRKQRIAERDRAVAALEQDLAVALEELRLADRFQSKDPEIFSRMEIVESQLDRELALRRKAVAESSLVLQAGLAESDLALLDIEARKAKLAIERAEATLRAMEVRAPHDGILVLERDWRGEPLKPGATVWPGMPLAEIPDLSEMEAELYVLEADGGGLEPGLEAEVRLDAHPERPFRGTVRSVDPLAKPRERGVPVQFFGVVVALERTEPRWMKPGQRVRAVLLADRVDEALVVPREAVFEREDGKFVLRRRGGRFEAVPVTLGPGAPGRVVVKAGVEEGDVVALADPAHTPGPGWARWMPFGSGAPWNGEGGG